MKTLAASRWELLVGIAVVAVVGMLFVPLPPVLVDVLLCANLAFALGLLLVASFTTTPLRLAALPTLLLLCTLVRLALNISTTRLILARADAGQLIESIGATVVQGSLVVGAVVFAVLAAVHFVVITRGTERIAEVAARFALDALPGRQAALDADRRVGGWSAAAARRRSDELLRESQLYGALDGVTRFVKGDAIAGLLITAINLVGGLALGVGRDGLPLADAAEVYTMLTIGDGLAALIPSVLIATATGIVITRVAGSDGSSDLAAELGAEFVRHPRVLALVAGFLVVLAALPGMPWPVLLALGALVGAAAVVSARVSQRNRSDIGAESEAPLRLRLSPTVRSWSEGGSEGPLGQLIEAVRDELRSDLGVTLGAVPVCIDPNLDPSVAWALHLDGALAATAPTDAGPEGTQSVQTQHLRTQHLRSLRHELARVARGGAASLLSLQEVSSQIDALARTSPALVEAVVPERATIARLTALLRRLLDDGLSVAPLPRILDALALAEPAPTSLDEQLEVVRIALGSRIVSPLLQNREGTPLRALLLSGEVESLLASLERGAGAAQTVRDDASRADLASALSFTLERAPCGVVVVPQRYRRVVAEVVTTSELPLSVVGLDELPSSTRVETRGLVRLPEPRS